MDELRERQAAWCKDLEQAVKADAWGQVLEAVEAYERLSEGMMDALPQCHELSHEQKNTIEKTARSLDLRAKCLSSVDGEHDSPSKEDVDDILHALRSLLSTAPPVFPLDLGGTARLTAKSSTVQVVEADGDQDLDLDELSLRAADTGAKPVDRAPGASYLDMQISKVGLKDATSYVNPTIVVSVYDNYGKRMEEQKETAIGSSDEALHISFGSATVQLETSLKTMEERGAAVFFEVYHFKAKKRKKSCRCWALLEMDEIADGPVVLELYQKPMDPTRKRINLFTVKDLFLHVQLRATAV